MSDEKNREKDTNLGGKKLIQEAGNLYRAEPGIYKDVAVIVCFFPVTMSVQP